MRVRAAALAPIGTSPPVVTEFLQYLMEAEGIGVTDLTVMATRDPQVMEGVRLIEAGVNDRYPHVRLRVVEMPFEDVDSRERVVDFASLASGALGELERAGASSIHVCVAGGRKDMSIALATISQFHPVSGVYHIVMPDVRNFNAELERARKDISDLAAQPEDRRLDFYRSRRSVLEHLLFPPPSSYGVIRIPVLPYPRGILRTVLGALRERRFRADRLEYGMLSQLSELGYVRVSGAEAYLTGDGEYLLKFLGAALGGFD